jgi:hypothetical protein
LRGLTEKPVSLPHVLRASALIILVAVAQIYPGGALHSFPTRPVHRASIEDDDPLLQVGEDLQYRVSYSIFTLGRIRIRVVDRHERDGQIVYKSQAFINSAAGLPFVNLHVLFESEIDADVFSHSWLSKDSTKSELTFRHYAFDYGQNRVVVEHSVQKTGRERVVERYDTVQITGKAQDGLSSFFFARKHLHSKAQMEVPTVIESKQVSTFINYKNKRTSVEIDALKYPVDVLEFEGRADYTGVFGLTGGFMGWFSNDAARVPIVARMKVIIGSIYIELERWERAGWTPPAFEKRP